MGLSAIGHGRDLYARAARSNDPRPSRFTGDDAYTEWAARADRSAPYLAHVPVAVVDLSGRISDRVLVETWEAVDSAFRAGTGEPVTVAGFGKVDAADLRTVWGWLLEVVKARYASEWEAVNDSELAEIESRAAASQGVAVEAIDWDAVPDELFDGKPSALDLAVSALRSHAA